MVRNRSAAGVIWVRTVAVLLPGRGSGSCAETPAFATTVPKAEGEVLTRVSTSPSALGTVVAKAGVSAHEPDPLPGNNTATVLTQITPAADLFLTMSGNPSAVIYGSNVTYTINLLNFGPSAATNVTVNDTFPAGMTLLSSNNSIGSISTSNNSVIWT